MYIMGCILSNLNNNKKILYSQINKDYELVIYFYVYF